MSVTAALLATTAQLGVAQAAPKPSGPPSPAAVATPAAATLPEVTMTCAPSQTDVNSAPLAQLMSTFGLDSSVANRLIGYRPYLAVSDILVVQGIGPGKLRAIVAGRGGCAAPTTTPPPAPSPCTSTSIVDLQSATAAQISSVTGVSTNAAAAVVAARPFASLRHVTPERVPGVGKGILDTIVSRSCLTPQPVRDAATSWRWGYPAYDTTVTRDGYALKAPAGVIDAGSGAWLSITPLATPADLPGPQYPRADFHIFGAWTGPRTTGAAPDEVLVTVPAASFAGDFDPAQFAPYIKHISADGVPGGGENVYNPSKVSVDPSTGSVTAALTSLSIAEWAVRQLNHVVEPAEGVLFGDRFPQPGCPNDPWAQEPGTALYDSPAGAHAQLTSALLNLPGGIAPLGGYLIKHCVETGTGTSGWHGGKDVQIVLRNSSGTVQVLKKYNGDIALAAKDEGGVQSADIPSLLVTKVATGGNIYLAPGDVGLADVPAGTFGSTQMQPDRLRSLLRIGLDKALGTAFDQLSANKWNSDPSLHNWLAHTTECAYNAFNALESHNGFGNSSRDFADALRGCFDYEGFSALIENWTRSGLASGALDGADSVRIHKGLETTREVFKWIEFGQIAVDVSDSLIWGSLPTAPTMIEHYAAKPTQDDLGRLVKTKCLSAYLYIWRIDMNCQNASYAQQQAPTGGGGDTGLPSGKIIRNSVGNSWFVTSADNKMHPITTGGTYLCLVRHYAVDWDVNGDDLRSYRDLSGPEGDAATCDDSLAPTRKITPANAPDLFSVLRIGDGPESWVIEGGYRYPIPTGTEFNCWVNPQYRANIEIDVFDEVSRSDLEKWPVGNGSISNCGDPEHPTF